MTTEQVLASHSVTFLAPAGATFSHSAYDVLADMYGVPVASIEGTQANYVPAITNSKILELIIHHGGFGAIAVETLAECRVDESLVSFIALLKKYRSTEMCNIQVVGAVKLRLNFALMAHPGVIMAPGTRLVAHAKAIGACKERIDSLGLQDQAVSSNGEAARLVAQDPAYATALALGPRRAAVQYGLRVLDEAFEDSEAITTFFLIGPGNHPVRTGQYNRVLLVCELPDCIGALVDALMPFKEYGLNLVQVHSHQCGNRKYRFAIEVEASAEQLPTLESALKKFAKCTTAHLRFGPFEVQSR